MEELEVVGGAEMMRNLSERLSSVVFLSDWKEARCLLIRGGGAIREDNERGGLELEPGDLHMPAPPLGHGPVHGRLYISVARPTTHALDNNQDEHLSLSSRPPQELIQRR